MDPIDDYEYDTDDETEQVLEQNGDDSSAVRVKLGVLTHAVCLNKSKLHELTMVRLRGYSADLPRKWNIPKETLVQATSGTEEFDHLACLVGEAIFEESSSKKLTLEQVLAADYTKPLAKRDCSDALSSESKQKTERESSEVLHVRYNMGSTTSKRFGQSQLAAEINALWSPFTSDQHSTEGGPGLCIIISLLPLNEPQMAALRFCFPEIECFTLEEMQIDVVNHFLQPTFRLLSSQETKEVAASVAISSDKSMKETLHRFPIIHRTDPVMRRFGAKPGEVFEITRKNWMALPNQVVVETSVSYRRVV